MAVSRYNNRETFFNNSDIYENVFQKRGVKHIKQYGTPVIDFPLAEEIRDLKLETHTWKSNDSFYKLAYEHYDDKSYTNNNLILMELQPRTNSFWLTVFRKL